MNYTKTMPWNVNELRYLYEQIGSGNWFSPNNMRAFKTKLTNHFKRVSDKQAYFITTERMDYYSPRRATVRKAVIEDIRRGDGALVSTISIQTVGEFNNLSLHQAKKFLKELGE
jgi:hypothetical protein